MFFSFSLVFKINFLPALADDLEIKVYDPSNASVECDGNEISGSKEREERKKKIKNLFLTLRLIRWSVGVHHSRARECRRIHYRN